MSALTPISWGLLATGLVLGYIIRQVLAANRANSVEQKLKEKTEKAKKEADLIISEAKQKSLEVLENAQKEIKEQKDKLDKSEERLINKEESLQEQLSNLTSRQEKVDIQLKENEKAKEEINEIRDKAVEKLEKIANLSATEAKERMMSELLEQNKEEVLTAVSKIEKERRNEIEKKASEVITTALMRYARTHVADATTSSVHLPDEELKGKIIGREGRNIKALERATGVDIIVDETPQSVILSSFDPLRREIARLTLEKLIKDGRIQPAKIEEKVEESKMDLIRHMQDIGEKATLEIGISGFSKEILQLIGRLHFRTSYGQNVLVHSIEMAHIAGMIAAEVGANVEIAKKGALVHDIGKAISHEVEGTHVELGRKILAKYGAEEAVIKAMESHHEDYPFSTPESFIVTAADILSAGRPGARRDTVEQYLKRVKELETLAGSFDGVSKAYALSAGREVRVFVVPEMIDDFGAYQLAKNISHKIQTELKYPGEIKVNVIRESRAVEYAR
ncbi:MAG: ribonuclease Y [Candidatus Harrisonbacteria bacterium CG10_big_fil_rev_8_21_14_0_10_38_8]|uniref:Ribonuclease Y n=1 Tax=Candidatus Harrisonbacteria bacterium CG10_big_fil_rev_8_21_14_0_10_38_8 TaxID=1974582 RepID=A0A2M6WKR9_9BACT|nr:MAG: ribonuclease Y [Candidatus Harrisonbacteria bacterium CG10_big_fil_rev_8_21_14_0_10_38_8]